MVLADARKKGGGTPLGVATSAILNRTRVCDALKRGVTTVGYGRGRRSRRTRTKVARIRSCCRPFVDYHPSTETAQGCKALCRLVGAPGFEPGTPCSQSLAQGGPFTDNIRIYAGFARIRGPVMRANTDPIRNSTYPVTYPPPSAAWSW